MLALRSLRPEGDPGPPPIISDRLLLDAFRGLSRSPMPGRVGWVGATLTVALSDRDKEDPPSSEVGGGSWNEDAAI